MVVVTRERFIKGLITIILSYLRYENEKK